VQKQRLIFLIVGIVLGLVAIVMVNIYIKDQAENVKRQAQKAVERMRQNQVAVLVARVDIPAEATIQSSMFDTAIVPREYVQPQTATSADSIAGMVTIAPISKGEQINIGKLTQSGQQTKRRDLASLTPAGKRAVTVAAENLGELVGMIKPQDFVDVIALVPVPTEEGNNKQGVKQTIMPVFQNVLVLAVGQETNPQAPAQRGREKASNITLALDPKEANILAFLQEQGKIRVALRSQNDTQLEQVEPITWDSVLNYVPGLRPPEVKIEPQETIEIYRGLTKERIPVSKE